MNILKDLQLTVSHCTKEGRELNNKRWQVDNDPELKRPENSIPPIVVSDFCTSIYSVEILKPLAVGGEFKYIPSQITDNVNTETSGVSPSGLY